VDFSDLVGLAGSAAGSLGGTGANRSAI